MTQKDDEPQPKNTQTAFGRRDFLKLGGYLSGAAVLGASGITRAVAAGGRKTLTIGNIGWDEDVALSYLSKVLLQEELGYDVTVTKRGVEDLFKGVAEGSLDTFQDVWLPRTHQSYWKQYGEKMEQLGSWYRGFATLGLTVPDYVPVQSIAELGAYRSQFDGKIIGIEPGAGEMKIVKDKVMPGYQLNQFELVSSSTPHMLKELAQALRAQKPIVVTLYKPHWAFTAYRIRYLKDPKGLISSENERLYSVVRRGLKEEKPDAYAFLNAISLTPEQLQHLELSINGAKDPEDGVQSWLRGNSPFGGSQRSPNRQLVKPWIAAAKEARARQ